METGSEIIVKPDRVPDFVAPVGHAFWWSEMIMMHVYGPLFKMSIDQSNGSLCYTVPRHSGNNDLVHLEPYAKELYDKWWYEAFESKFLGDESE
jgi:hypothetical protein